MTLPRCEAMKPLTHADVGRATHAQIRALLDECAAWRQVTGYADPEAFKRAAGAERERDALRGARARPRRTQ